MIVTGASVVTWAHARPGAEILGRGKLFHVRTGLCQNAGGASWLDSRYRLQQFPGWLESRLLDLGLHVPIQIQDLLL